MLASVARPDPALTSLQAESVRRRIIDARVSAEVQVGDVVRDEEELEISATLAGNAITIRCSSALESAAVALSRGCTARVVGICKAIGRGEATIRAESIEKTADAPPTPPPAPRRRRSWRRKSLGRHHRPRRNLDCRPSRSADLHPPVVRRCRRRLGYAASSAAHGSALRGRSSSRGWSASNGERVQSSHVRASNQTQPT